MMSKNGSTMVRRRNYDDARMRVRRCYDASMMNENGATLERECSRCCDVFVFSD